MKRIRHGSGRMRHVALIYDATRAYDLKVMTGVAAHLQEGASWNVYIEENSLKDQRLPDLRAWQGDGIIADFDNPRVAAAVVESKLPAVAFGSGYGWYPPQSRIPYFFTNNRAIAEMAADHLLDRGFHHFAYCGYPLTPISGWSQERERGFVARLKRRGFACRVFRGRRAAGRGWPAMQNTLREWLGALPKPLAVMAANDNRARQVLEACRAQSLRVPEEVAVIGVDNDELLCRLSSPLLTSIEQGAERIGYQAAMMLDSIMDGRRPRRRRIVVDPMGVVTRRSTDILAIEDPLAAKAMAFIWENATRGIKVKEVAEAAICSRAALEARFKLALGYSVHAAIGNVRLEQARRLVRETNLSLKQVAANTGFKSVQHMTTVFGRAFGQPPAAYRLGSGPEPLK